MKKVLLAEDNNFILDVLSQKFSDRYDFEYVRDGRGAIAKIKEFHPDVLLLDIELPHVSGIEILKMIRSDASLNNISILIFSNHTGEIKYIEEMEGYDNVRFVSKASLSPDQLVELIDSL